MFNKFHGMMSTKCLLVATKEQSSTIWGREMGQEVLTNYEIDTYQTL